MSRRFLLVENHPTETINKISGQSFKDLIRSQYYHQPSSDHLLPQAGTDTHFPVFYFSNDKLFAKFFYVSVG